MFTIPKHLLAALCGLVLLVNHAGAADQLTGKPSETRKGPVISCAEPRFNFGEKYETEVVKHSFKVKNEGTERLTISRVRAECFCTRARLDEKSLAPGETTDVVVEMTLKGRSGYQNKSVRVESNDPEKPNLMLYMEGSALTDIEVKPRHVYFGGAAADTVSTSAVDVTTRRSVEITGVVSSVDFVTASLTAVATGRQYQVAVGTKPPLKAGANRGNLVLYRKDGGTFDVPVSVMVVGPLSVAPQELMLVAAKDRPVTRYVILRPGTVQEFEVTGVDVPDDRISSVVSPLTGSGGYRIQLDKIPCEKTLDGKSVIIKTTADEMSEIEIPFRVSAEQER